MEINNFPRIVGILSYILCSEFIHYFREIFNVTLGVPNATEGSFFGSGGRDPCNLSGVHLGRQFMKLSSFICLTYHLSDNLKTRYKFFPIPILIKSSGFICATYIARTFSVDGANWTLDLCEARLIHFLLLNR